MRKEIVYPVFVECMRYAPDTFWENIFEDLGYGKTPCGTFLSKGFLCCNYRRKDFQYLFAGKDSKIVFDDVYKLLSEKLGILSNCEKIQRLKTMNDMDDDLRDSRSLSWSNIRKKNTKELLLELYVIRMKNEHGLTIAQTRYLYSMIFIALMITKTITSDDIDYVDGMIRSINGVSFGRKSIHIERNLYKNDNMTALSINDYDIEFITDSDKRYLSDQWYKFLKRFTD